MTTLADIVTYDPSKARSMTVKPRRYVRVRLVRGLGPDGHGVYRTRPWWRWECICGVWGGKYVLVDSHANASKHARKCGAIRIATERDQLEQKVQRLGDDLVTAHSDHMHDLARLTAHAGRIEIERDQWRTKAHELAAELREREIALRALIADIAQYQKGDTQEMARTRASGEENTVEQGCPCTCHTDPGFPLWDSHRCLCKRST